MDVSGMVQSAIPLLTQFALKVVGAIALWFLANFFGNLLAGAFGRLWSSLSPPQFFAATAAIAALSGALLLAFNRPTQRAEAE